MTGSDPDAQIEKTAVERAIDWLTIHLDDCPRPIIPYVKQAYGLRNLDAIEAVRLARLKRGGEA
jgi:hypothetical protein